MTVLFLMLILAAMVTVSAIIVYLIVKKPGKAVPKLGEPIFARPVSQRDLRGWGGFLATWLGGIVTTGILCWLIYNFMFGAWAPTTQVQRLTTLGYISFGMVGILVVIFTSYGMMINPRKVKGTGPGGTSFEVSGGDEPAATVTTTVTQSTSLPPSSTSTE